MFKTRLISGIALIGILILSIISESLILTIFSCFVSIVGLYEFLKLRKIELKKFSILTYISVIFYYFNIAYYGNTYGIYIFLVLFILAAFIYVINFENSNIEDIVHTVFGYIYIPIFFSFVLQIRYIDNILIWLVFISAWGSDTMAYVVGKLIGKHKLTPKLSPKKTIEGSIGGILGAMTIAYIFIFTFEKINFGAIKVYTTNIYIIVLVIVFFASICSQVGDLFASAFKRHYDVKDFGNLIPGHGGVLDRFDSILFTAPVVYLILSMFLRIG